MTDAEILSHIERTRFNWPKFCAVMRTAIFCDWIREREYEYLGIERVFKIPYWVTK